MAGILSDKEKSTELFSDREPVTEADITAALESGTTEQLPIIKTKIPFVVVTQSPQMFDHKIVTPKQSPN